MMNIDNPVYKKNKEFLDRVNGLKQAKYPEKEVAQLMGLENTMELRKKISRAHAENREILVALAKEMKEAGKSIHEIAIELGKNESTVRLLLDESVQNKIKKVYDYHRFKMTPEEKQMWDSGDVNQRLQVRKAMRAEGRCEVREVHA